MKVNLTYPIAAKRSRFFDHFRRVAGYVFFLATLTCGIVNAIVGPPAWSLVAIWSMYTVWALLLNPDMVEMNLISQLVKVLWHASVLLWLIDHFLAPGWANFVIPILMFVILLVTAFVYALDRDKQRHNVMPLLWLIVFSIAGFVASMAGLTDFNWPFQVLGAITGALLIMGILFFHKDIWAELKKRFHMD